MQKNFFWVWSYFSEQNFKNFAWNYRFTEALILPKKSHAEPNLHFVFYGFFDVSG